MARILAVLALLALLALLAGACGDDDAPVAAGDGDGPAPGAPFEPSGEYLSVEVTEAGAPRPLVGDTRVSLEFRDGTLGARAGCNSMSGPYSIDAGTLLVAELAMTEMGCEPPLMDQDRWLAELLSSSPALKATDDGFLLTSGTTEVRFVDREIAEPDAELVGTTWTVTGFVDGDMAMSPAADPPGTLVFDPNGFVTGNDGCNGLGYATAPGEAPEGLAYRVEGDTISFEGSPAMTEIACPDREDHIERYHAVLTGTVTWEIDAQALTLLTDDRRGVTYVAER